jgi:Na+-driven multidrug efflux pump
MRLRWSLFRDILRVGLVAALITVQTNLTIAIATSLVGSFGPAAIAGYGTGSRLEYLLIPVCAENLDSAILVMKTAENRS